MTRIVKFTLLALAVALTSACAVQPKLVTKQKAFPNMYAEHTNSILVVPVINNSTAADAPDLYEATIAEPLADAGHYVMPIEVTTDLLRKEGISNGAQLKDVSPQHLGKIFGADSILYVTIDKWDTNYYVVGGNVTVAISYLLRSAKTGDVLWDYKGQQVVDTSDNSGGGILVALIATAVKTAIQDYVPVARQVNFAAVKTMPLGKYNPRMGKDGPDRVVPPNDVVKEK